MFLWFFPNNDLTRSVSGSEIFFILTKHDGHHRFWMTRQFINTGSPISFQIKEYDRPIFRSCNSFCVSYIFWLFFSTMNDLRKYWFKMTFWSKTSTSKSTWGSNSVYSGVECSKDENIRYINKLEYKAIHSHRSNTLFLSQRFLPKWCYGSKRIRDFKQVQVFWRSHSDQKERHIFRYWYGCNWTLSCLLNCNSAPFLYFASATSTSFSGFK